MRHLGLDYCHLLVYDYGNTAAQELLARHEEQPSLSPDARRAIDLRSALRHYETFRNQHQRD